MNSLVIADHFGGTADHDPVLGAVSHLQAELGSRLDHDALYLEMGAGIDRIVIAPRAEDFPAPCRLRRAAQSSRR